MRQGWRDRVWVIAQTLCECDAQQWETIIPYQRDRYMRIAILVDDRINQKSGGESEDGPSDGMRLVCRR